MAELLYSARFDGPDEIERGRSVLLRCPVYRSGTTAVLPTSGTFTLYDPTDTAILGPSAVTITSSIAQYAVTGLTAYDYADGWASEWALALPDGVTHTFRNGASLVMVAGHPALTDGDLFRRNSALDPTGSPITSHANYQDFIDESWHQIRRKLRQAGRRPWLIYDATELKEAHLLLTLALIYEDLATRKSEAYRETAREYRAQWAAEWSAAKLTLQWAEDSHVGSTTEKTSPRHGSFWLLGRGI